LTRDALYAALQLRALVFVVEQRCPFLDLDGADAEASHLLGWTDDPAGGPLSAPTRGCTRRASSTRRRRSGASSRTRRCAAAAPAGRSCARRSTGSWTPGALVPGAPVRIGAQLYLERFYEGFGFQRASAVYDEDGIDHVEMVR
jgi:ElaA protein